MTKANLRRYTSISATIHLLRTQKITLLNPRRWDDKNDTYSIEKYRDTKGLSAILAVCFARAPETYHHWRVFTQGQEGACIAFNEAKLKDALKPVQNLRWGDVKYKQISQIEVQTPKWSELPFIKRYPYRDEREVRVIFESTELDLDFLDFEIGLDCIEAITINPWVNANLFKSLRDTLKGISGCERVQIFQTTLLDNEQWKLGITSWPLVKL
jgi:hypothetical protein